MAKSAMPLLLVAGGAALLLGTKKKKKSSTATKEDTPYDLPEYNEEEVYIQPDPEPKERPSDIPAGNPPRGDTYDAGYWGSTSDERLENIRVHFIYLGYSVEIGPWPMNVLGPKGDHELTNKDGTKGKLGGDDDQPNETVRDFQRNYNQVSRLNKAEKYFPSNMGGLAKDALVGPYTLNGLRYAVEELKAGKAGGKTWNDLISQAELKGIN
jgi:hypothetical protein